MTLHADISIHMLYDIAKLKHLAWPAYTVSQHLSWMMDNLKDDDEHHCIYHHGLVAYINTFNIEAEIEGKKQSIMGIGNLCSKTDDLHGMNLYKQVLKKDKIYLGFSLNHILPYHLFIGFKVIENPDMPNIDLQKYKAIIYGSDAANVKYTGKRL